MIDFVLVKMGKNLESVSIKGQGHIFIFGVSTDYLINAWFKKGGMLPNYAPLLWPRSLLKKGGGGTLTIFLVKMGKYLYKRSKPYIYL